MFYICMVHAHYLYNTYVDIFYIYSKLYFQSSNCPFIANIPGNVWQVPAAMLLRRCWFPGSIAPCGAEDLLIPSEAGPGRTRCFRSYSTLLTGRGTVCWETPKASIILQGVGYAFFIFKISASLHLYCQISEFQWVACVRQSALLWH